MTIERGQFVFISDDTTEERRLAAAKETVVEAAVAEYEAAIGVKIRGSECLGLLETATAMRQAAVAVLVALRAEVGE